MDESKKKQYMIAFGLFFAVAIFIIVLLSFFLSKESYKIIKLSKDDENEEDEENDDMELYNNDMNSNMEHNMDYSKYN